MEIFYLFSALITLAAILSYLNVAFFRKPAGIVPIIMGAILSVIVLDRFYYLRNRLILNINSRLAYREIY